MADKDLIAGNKSNRKKKDFFNSKPMIFLVSLFCSMAIWCVVSMYETPVTNRVFQDVKVQMALSDTVPGLMNLSVFGNNEFYCDVTVNGKSYMVNDSSFSSDKIIVKPKLEEIRSPGIYDVELTAQLVNSSPELSVVSVEPQYITVYFDTPVEKEYNLILSGADEYTMADNCILDSMTLRPSTVIATGPSLEMHYIRDIKANVAFSEPISKTTAQPVSLEFVADGKEINYTIIKDQAAVYLDVQVSVLKSYEMKIDYVNAPEGIDLNDVFDYRFIDYDNKLTLYVPTESEALMTSDTITVGRIDMASFALTDYQTLPIERYNRNIFYDVLPDTLDVAFSMDSNLFTALTITVPVVNENADYDDYTFGDAIADVVLICDASRADDIATDRIYAVPDENELAKLTAGEQSASVRIVLPHDIDYAWVSGRYSTNVSVPEK